MKKLLVVITVGLLGTLMLLRNADRKKEMLQFVEEDPARKNFGAFPPEIPEDQFEGLFV